MLTHLLENPKASSQKSLASLATPESYDSIITIMALLLRQRSVKHLTVPKIQIDNNHLPWHLKNTAGITGQAPSSMRAIYFPLVSSANSPLT